MFESTGLAGLRGETAVKTEEDRHALDVGGREANAIYFQAVLKVEYPIRNDEMAFVFLGRTLAGCEFLLNCRQRYSEGVITLQRRFGRSRGCVRA